MNRCPLGRLAGVAVVVLFLASCAGTRLEHKEVNPAFRGKPVSDLLVIGITYRPDARRSFEDSFVSQLQAAGVEAVSSAEAIPMPRDLKIEKDAILAAIERYGSDGVIISHVKGVDIQSSESRFTPSESGFYGDYSVAYSTFGYEPGAYTSRTVLRIETNLYDAESEERMWSGTSRTVEEGSEQAIIDEVIRVVIGDLLDSGMIVPQ